MLNIKHNSTKNIPPREQEIAKVKNKLKKLDNRLLTNDVIARVGIIKIAKYIKCFFIFRFWQTFFFIILKFKILEIVKHIPIEYVSASIPTYFGKNQIPISIKIPPTI